MLPFFYTLAILIAGLAVLREGWISQPSGQPSVEWDRKRTVAFVALCGALFLCFLCQTLLNQDATTSQTPLPQWFDRALPLQYFAPTAPFSARPNQTLVEWTDALAVVESAILAAVYFLIRRTNCAKPAITAVTVFFAAGLGVVAFLSSTTDVDLYLYVAHALLWPQQYAPPAVAFHGQDHWINIIWGNPIVPSAYGPLWNALTHLAIAPAHSLSQQVLSLRLVGLASIAVCVLCVYRLLGSGVVPVLFALNPAMYGNYAMRAHNDLTGVAFILAAAVLKKRTWLAILLIAAAGMIKFPLLLGGLLVFWDRPSLKARVYPAVAAGLTCLAGSIAFGGEAYIRALGAVYHMYDHSPPPLQLTLHLAVVAIALAAVAAALWRKRFLSGAEWSFASLGQYALPQYLAWCLPYALLGGASAVPFLVSWPIVDDVLSLNYGATNVFLIERTVLVAGIVAAIVLTIFARRLRSSGPIGRVNVPLTRA